VSTTLLETQNFEVWEQHLGQAIGHHRSELLTPEIPFYSRLQIDSVCDVSVVAIEGTSSLRLKRTQPPDHAVLWLPQRGWVADHVNGAELVAEPGTAMLCLPGDDLHGDTSPLLSGFSILLRSALLGDPSGWHSLQRRHLRQGPQELTLIQMARDLVELVRAADANSGLALIALADQILYWRDLCLSSAGDAGNPVDRRALIALAREWIEAHLAQPFRLAHLAAALHVAPRTLQLAFREELGRPPMEEVRRLRFVALRRLLLHRPGAKQGLEDMFYRCGLALSPQSKRWYRDWCGETPEQTRARAVGS
jgi:AraC-like DNA-binding protein